MGGRNGKRFIDYKKVHEMGVENRWENAEIYDERKRKRLERRTMGYEEKLKEGGGNEWERKCWEEVKEEEKGGDSKWEIQRIFIEGEGCRWSE